VSRIFTPQPSTPELRILLGDDHTLLRHGLRKILEARADWKSSPKRTMAARPWIETHRAHILSKLNVHNIAGLVLYAVRRGVIS
jgi:DNA-binding NarL/FixJ family response regulator